MICILNELTNLVRCIRDFLVCLLSKLLVFPGVVVRGNCLAQVLPHTSLGMNHLVSRHYISKSGCLNQYYEI
jgi:hypothetical protein